IVGGGAAHPAGDRAVGRGDRGDRRGDPATPAWVDPPRPGRRGGDAAPCPGRPRGIRGPRLVQRGRAGGAPQGGGGVGRRPGLVALGARNRYANLPAVTGRGERVRSLRRTVGAEVTLAVGIFGVTGVLTQLPPAAHVAAAAPSPGPAQVVVTGSDFATSVRVRLTVMPGTVGPNHFEARLADYDTGKPFPASSVSLKFSLPSHSELGTPSLDLSRLAPGAWMGARTSLSMPGAWNVSVLIQGPAGSVVV